MLQELQQCMMQRRMGHLMLQELQLCAPSQVMLQELQHCTLGKMMLQKQHQCTVGQVMQQRHTDGRLKRRKKWCGSN